MKKILVVDDRMSSLKVLAAILTDEGYEVLRAADGKEALRIYASGVEIDAVLSDFKMPQMDGLELFKAMNGIRKAPPFIIMSAYGTVKSAVQALQEGITHYLIKPLDYEELGIVLKKAIRDREMAIELTTLKRQIEDENAYHGIVGRSPKMLDIFEMVRTVGKTDASVMICGETGTGKELLARALHMESRRRKAEMVCINSAALTENLLEAELFGYVKGAFTGAEAGSKGRLEMADHGTLFLDEIGYMSLRLQTKLLRFLQEKTFEPVGSTVSRHVDTRIIAATNHDLQEQIRKGGFLRDLLYRIEVINIQVPPLRERKGDIYLLVHHFTKLYARQYEKAVEGIEPDAMEALVKHHWPGNVRELKNYIERAVILSKKPKLCLEDFPKFNRVSGTPSAHFPGKKPIDSLFEDKYSLQEVERELIRTTLEKYDGNKSLTAQHLGISRKTLYKKLADYAME
jgi:DNA-binding NtrC family response regulator